MKYNHVHLYISSDVLARPIGLALKVIFNQESSPNPVPWERKERGMETER